MAETESFGRCIEESSFETGDGLVDEVVYGVDDVVNQGLARISVNSCLIFSESRPVALTNGV